jgi:hypothetical protein
MLHLFKYNIYKYIILHISLPILSINETTIKTINQLEAKYRFTLNESIQIYKHILSQKNLELCAYSYAVSIVTNAYFLAFIHANILNNIPLKNALNTYAQRKSHFTYDDEKQICWIDVGDIKLIGQIKNNNQLYLFFQRDEYFLEKNDFWVPLNLHPTRSAEPEAECDPQLYKTSKKKINTEIIEKLYTFFDDIEIITINNDIEIPHEFIEAEYNMRNLFYYANTPNPYTKWQQLFINFGFYASLYLLYLSFIILLNIFISQILLYTDNAIIIYMIAIFLIYVKL